MKRVLVTGANGFIGRNLVVALRRRDDVALETFDVSDEPQRLEHLAARADIIYHLAGVNRPTQIEEFESGNARLTERLVEVLRVERREPVVVFTSSTQAVLDNPYGESKRRAEEALRALGRETGARVIIYRLPGVFGKWCRPNYNSVVATFCHNVARELEITVSDPGRVIDLVYVDDVVAEFLRAFDLGPDLATTPSVSPVFQISLGDLADRIRRLRDIRETLIVPDLSDELTRRLHATFLAYLPEDAFSYQPEERSDARGSLVELLKSPHFGQVFVSTSHPGVVRGNHYHDSKIEKFCVIRGSAILRFRHVERDEVLEYPVSGARIEIVDIPPGYTHSIENVGSDELVVLFWANQMFDANHADTFPMKV